MSVALSRPVWGQPGALVRENEAESQCSVPAKELPGTDGWAAPQGGGQGPGAAGQVRREPDPPHGEEDGSPASRGPSLCTTPAVRPALNALFCPSQPSSQAQSQSHRLQKICPVSQPPPPAQARRAGCVLIILVTNPQQLNTIGFLCV